MSELSPATRRPPGDGDTRIAALGVVRAACSSAGGGPFLGRGATGPVWARSEQAVLVLGPPRSGKTSSIVIPSVLGAPGAVLSTSTKPDVLRSTASARLEIGPCLLYDPSGTVDAPRGVEPLRWSPVNSSVHWDDALLVARSMVRAGGIVAGPAPGTTSSEHFRERAEALLATVLHAAALDGHEMATVLAWIDRRQAAPALDVLDQRGREIPADLLAGISATEAREQSGIWSTASGVLGAYRSDAALSTTRSADFDARGFCDSSATLYVAATGRHQAMVAPLVVGLLTDIRSALYARDATRGPAGGRPPLVLALDEVANIAPIPDLPAMVSEGGGQGLVTLACLQDLSQARGRWGAAADGFLSLFGTTVVLPGIADLRTLEALSALAGEEEVRTRAVSAPVRPGRGVGRAFLERLAHGGRQPARSLPTLTTSVTRRSRLPVDSAGRGHPGLALVLDERNEMGWIRLTPWFSTEPWRSAAGMPQVPGHDLVTTALPTPSDRPRWFDRPACPTDSGRRGTPEGGPDLGR